MKDTKELIDELNKTASSLEDLAATADDMSKTASVSAPAVPERTEYVQGVLSAFGLDD